jgi:hypothetical protein
MSTNNGGRGEFVGSDSVRAAWHKSRGRHAIKTPVLDKDGKVVGQQRRFVLNEGPSMKEWASNILLNAGKTGEDSTLSNMCRKWFAAKAGEFNQKRTQANQDLAEIIGRASRAARKSSKATGKKKEKAPTTDGTSTGF